MQSASYEPCQTVETVVLMTGLKSNQVLEHGTLLLYSVNIVQLAMEQRSILPT